MLLLSSDSFTVDGVTVFPDHADPNQFWYLPSPVSLAMMPGSDEPQFLLIEYAPDVAGGGMQAVGFLNVTVWLRVDPGTLNKITGQISNIFPNADNPHLAPVPFDDGTVQVVSLDMQGSGGASNTAAPGAIQMVEHILGATSPELFGDNNALFALTLSADGATILKDAFQDGMAPVGAIYSLKFTGVRPALDVKVTADLKRVYESFSVDLTVKYYASAGIDATFEKLRQDGAIKIEVVNLAGDATNADAEKQALDMFKQDILTTWFTPSLSPTTAAAADASSVNTSIGTTPAKPAPPSPPPPPPAKAGAISAASNSGSTMKAPAGGAMQPAGAAKPAGGGGAAGAAGAGAAAGVAGAAGASGGGGAAKPAGGGGASGAAGAAPPAAPSGGGTAAAVSDTAKAATAVANAISGAGNSAAPFGATLQLKFVHQDEQKTVTYEYNRMDAVQRTFAPQGYFGLLLNGIDETKHFLQVNGTDEFFRQFSVVLTPPKDFASIGLQTAHVALDYGDPGSADGKHGEFVFDAAHAAQTTWEVFEGDVHETQYTYTTTFSFDPAAGWVGDSDTCVLPTQTTENRQINLDPHDTFGFLAVAVSPGRINADTVDRVEISLNYADNNGWTTSTDFVVRPGAPAQIWKLRLRDKDKPTYQSSYSYTTRCVLKDGTVFPGGPYFSSASTVFVNDAFNSGIDVLIQPAFDATHTKSVLVELTYSDDAAGYQFSTTQFLQSANNPSLTRVHIPVLSADLKNYSYRVTIITATDQQLQGSTVTTTDPLIVVGNTL